MALLNDLASVSEPRWKLAPLLRHTHNMKGCPLNVMEVAGTSKSQYEWKVNIYKIGSRVMVFRSFRQFWSCPGDDFWQVFSLSAYRSFKKAHQLNTLLDSSF